MFRTSPLVAAVAAILVCTVAGPARAIRCSEWSRLDAGGRSYTMQQLIADAPNHPTLRGRQFNATRLQMCLGRIQSWIEADFDEACSRGQRTDLQALNGIMRHYIGTCTSGRR